MQSFDNVPEPARKQTTNSQDNKHQEILNIINTILEDEKFTEPTPEQIYRALDSCISQEAMHDILKEYTGNKKAKSLAQKIFKMMGKDRCTYAKIEYLYREVERTEGSIYIQDLRQAAEKGKRKKLYNLLVKACGQVKGKRLYQEYGGQIPQIKSTAYNQARKIRTKGGIDFYEYPQSIITQQMKNEAKTMIVFGETGSGKSTFLNAIVNYLAMIDQEDTFRYQIVVEHANTQMESKTQNITTYFAVDVNKGINNQHCYRIIDTPGFGDTNGIKRDEQHMQNIKKFFSKTHFQIHAILFVLKSSVNRVTLFQKYVFQSVMDLFGKDIAKNFCFIFTFNDSGKPLALEAVQDQKYGFGEYWSLLSQPKYLAVSCPGIFERIESTNPESSMKQRQWQIGMEGIKNLIKKVNMLPGNSLTMTKEMIKKKQNFFLRLRYARQSLQLSIDKRQCLLQKIKNFSNYSKQINENKNYLISYQEVQPYEERTNYNITRCKFCRQDNCHISCVYGDNDDKRNCSAMDSNGRCTVCKNRCRWNDHRNENVVFRTRKVSKYTTNQEIKKRYDIATNQHNVAEIYICKLLQQLDLAILKTAQHAQEILILEEELSKICMTKRRQESVVQYLKYLVQQEKKDKSPGYQQRINAFNQNIFQYQSMKAELEKDVKAAKNFQKQNGNQQLQKKIKIERYQRIVEKLDSSIWDKIKHKMLSFC